MGLFCNHSQELQFLRNRVADQDEIVRDLTRKLLELTAQVTTQMVALSNPVATRELNRTERDRRESDPAPLRALLPGHRPNYRPASPPGSATSSEGLTSMREANELLDKH